MEVTPLAFESLGVRSSSILVQTEDARIVIDPAVALAPNRYGLPPHTLEEEAKKRLWGKVKEEAEAADILVVTHYHFDHVDPKEPELYTGKRVLLKHPRRMINPSQKNRAASVLKSIKGLAAEIIYADNQRLRLGGTEIRFSKPVPHGSDATRGYVVGVCVEAGESFLYTSDVQGPLLEEHLRFIMAEKPETIIVDGPSTYFDSPFQEIELRRANENLVKIIREAGVGRLVLDHHLARDLDYEMKIKPVLDAGEESGIWVGVVAEFLDREPNLLEARRKELYGKEEG
jgi:predicted metallo-beta-lactamase superfamily hydrolase